MTDKEILNEAYAGLLKSIFGNFFGAFTGAKGDGAQEKLAIDTFKAHVAHARYVRDQAISALP